MGENPPEETVPAGEAIGDGVDVNLDGIDDQAAPLAQTEVSPPADSDFGKIADEEMRAFEEFLREQNPPSLGNAVLPANPEQDGALAPPPAFDQVAFDALLYAAPAPTKPAPTPKEIDVLVGIDALAAVARMMRPPSCAANGFAPDPNLTSPEDAAHFSSSPDFFSAPSAAAVGIAPSAELPCVPTDEQGAADDFGVPIEWPPESCDGNVPPDEHQVVVLQVESVDGVPSTCISPEEDVIPPVPADAADDDNWPVFPVNAVPTSEQPGAEKASATASIPERIRFQRRGLRIFEGRIIEAKLQEILKDLKRPEALAPSAIPEQRPEEVPAVSANVVPAPSALPTDMCFDGWAAGHPVDALPELSMPPAWTSLPAAPVEVTPPPRAEIVVTAVVAPTDEQPAPVILPPAPVQEAPRRGDTVASVAAPDEIPLLNPSFAAFEEGGRSFQAKQRRIRRLIAAAVLGVVIIPSTAVILARRYHAAPEVKSPAAAAPAAPVQRIKDCEFTITLGNTGLVGMHLFRGTALQEGEKITGNVCFKRDPNSRSCETSRKCDITRSGEDVTVTCDMLREEIGNPSVDFDCKTVDL